MSDASDLFKAIQKAGVDVDGFVAAVDAEIESRKNRIKEDEKKAKAEFQKLVKLQEGKKKLPAPSAPPTKEKEYPETLACPECGQVAYAQSVCPGCSKGKAGIKRQYICGECNFAFYLD